MKAFVLDRYRKGGTLRLQPDRPVPTPGDEEVLVAVRAAGLNPLDSRIRDGDFKLLLPYRLPLVLGHDLAGVVTQVGAKVQAFKPGDEVYARAPDFHIGAFAEFIAVHSSSLALKPKGLTMAEAAAIPLAGLTAWQALVVKGGLQPGQKVFIQAGAGGVGTFAIQLARHLGATVATTASQANAGLVKGLGADVVIDHRTQDFEEVLRDYDLVLHSQDGKTLEKSLRVLRPGGQLVSISGPPDPSFGRAMAASLLLRGAFRLLSAKVRHRAQRLGVGYAFLFMQPSGDQLRQIASLIEGGAMRPVMDSVFPFESLNEAMARVDTGRVKGKVVVTLG